MSLAPPRTLAELHTRARELGAAAPLGKSVDGRVIEAIEVPGASPKGPTTVVIAGLHAMEHVGVMVALELLERAASGQCRWPGPLWVLPVCNPDGYTDVEQGLSWRHRFWRENRRGVDLNRNFGVGFSGAGSLARFWGAGDRGPAALSEPETRAVHRLLVRARPTVFVSLHAFGNVIFTPHARTRHPALDDSRHRKVAAAMGRASGYRVRQLARYIPGFRAFGTELDHARELGALSFLIEIGAGPRLSAPASWWPVYRWYTPPPALLERDLMRARRAVEAVATTMDSAAGS